MLREIRRLSDLNLPDRRSFLAAGVAGSVLAAVLPTNAQTENKNDTPLKLASEPSFELSELSIADLQRRMELGEFTARQLAEKYLARIDAIDAHGPRLGSVIELNPDTLDMADALDQERRSKGSRGPLHGIPVLIKDNIDTADKMATTSGSLALVGSKPPEDAFLVKQLRKAGALVIGKTNMSEWSNVRSINSTSGWSRPWRADPQSVCLGS